VSRKGLVHIYTGEGKGKTTAALGLAVRAAGSGMKVLFVQFFKEDSAESGEKELLRALEGFHIELVRSNCRHPIFTGGVPEVEKKAGEAVRATYMDATTKAVDEGFDMLVLDEMLSVVNGGWVTSGELFDFLDSRPETLEVVLTGRDAPVELVQVSDYVTEMLKIKHPYDAGVQARPGVEF
jgi:cob(I)alamin adenosyltransferase